MSVHNAVYLQQRDDAVRYDANQWISFYTNNTESRVRCDADFFPMHSFLDGSWKTFSVKHGETTSTLFHGLPIG